MHLDTDNVVDGLYATTKRYLKEQMELIGKLSSNHTSKIGMLPNPSKYVFIKISEQCLHILDNKDRLNGLKVIKKIQKIESLFKYQSRFYNVQRNNDVQHKGTKM